MNQLNELIAIATIFFGILLLLVSIILSAGVFLFDFELYKSGSSFGSYTLPAVIGALGYIIFGAGFVEFLKQRRSNIYFLFFIIFIVTLVLLILLMKFFNLLS